MYVCQLVKDAGHMQNLIGRKFTNGVPGVVVGVLSFRGVIGRVTALHRRRGRGASGRNIRHAAALSGTVIRTEYSVVFPAAADNTELCSWRSDTTTDSLLSFLRVPMATLAKS